MPLPAPNLDDRHFQQIVDQAKSLIPQYCPEWTDHNVSDPGVTLIELFAWMTDLLLYRVNQVPDKVYVKFLEMLGIRLQPPRAARTSVTFYLSAPQPELVVIPAGTEVATVRTETAPPIMFSTEEALAIRPPVLSKLLTKKNVPNGKDIWTERDPNQFRLPGSEFPLFPDTPEPGDAFYVGFAADMSHHVLGLALDCDAAGGAGVDPEEPPIAWQAWCGPLERTGWTPCTVEHDTSGGFNKPGEVQLRLPGMTARMLEGTEAFWLRCVLTKAQAQEDGSYKVSPDLRALTAEARGGTAPARHAQTVTGEALGTSSGAPGQTFTLQHSPVLPRTEEREILIEVQPGGAERRWEEAADFAASGPEDRHYTLDRIDGTLALGPALLQPSGEVYRFGAVPLKGSALRFQAYRHGGGVVGNVPAGALTVPKSSIPYVERVANHEPGEGGLDAESLEHAKLRAARELRTRTRAVTADDYEYLAQQVDGVARARCIAPGQQPGASEDVRPGQVFVIILPRLDVLDWSRPIAPERLAPSAELHAAVSRALGERKLLGTSLDVRPPKYVWVAVHLTLRVAEEAGREGEAIEQQVSRALYQYINPYTGGPEAAGWPFGRSLHQSEVISRVQQVSGVEFVEEVVLGLVEPGRPDSFRPVSPHIEVPAHALVCSWEHQIRIA